MGRKQSSPTTSFHATAPKHAQYQTMKMDFGSKRPLPAIPMQVISMLEISTPFMCM